jgi:hypothetical protein
MHHTGRVGNFRRFLATVFAVLVFALGLFAASPVLHSQLHHNDPATADDGCAIVLFASGVTTLLVVARMRPPTIVRREQLPAASTEVFLDSPRYLLQPERGPPWSEFV